jgi:mitochondrial chaperone BCS1
VILLDDVDAMGTSVDRESTEPATGNKAADEKVTLSGILKAMDGFFCNDRQIVILTTNYPEKLDKAIRRSSRLDVQEEFGLLDECTARQMARRYLEGDVYRQCVESTVYPIVASDMQERIIQAHGA